MPKKGIMPEPQVHNSVNIASVPVVVIITILHTLSCYYRKIHPVENNSTSTSTDSNPY